MGFPARILLVLVSLAIAVSYKNFKDFTKNLPAPDVDLDEYWGPGANPLSVSTKIEPFTISYADKVIELRNVLGQPLQLPEPLEGTGFEYGFNSKKLKEVVKFWRDDYLPRWRQREEFLGQYPQFTTQIQGLKIHYLHIKPSKTAIAKKKVLPLILLHGWPGSVREFYELIPKLTNPSPKSDYVFEVIVPSLPGYGWSQAAAKKGLSPLKIGVILRNLMHRIGHKRYLIQGGDWGAVIGTAMATIFPNEVIGYHSNMCFTLSPLSNVKSFIAGLYPSFFVDKEVEGFFFPVMEKFLFQIEESGYMHLQATKPDTIGTALAQNPVGLAAYILEKFSTWTNADYRQLKDGGLTKDFILDALLDNVMIYYLTNSITTSQRLYAECFNKEALGVELDRVPTEVPTGCARFKNDLAHAMDWQLKDKFFNLIHSTYHQNGGHFAAMQLPDVFYDDFVQFVGKLDIVKE